MDRDTITLKLHPSIHKLHMSHDHIRRILVWVASPSGVASLKAEPPATIEEVRVLRVSTLLRNLLLVAAVASFGLSSPEPAEAECNLVVRLDYVCCVSSFGGCDYYACSDGWNYDFCQ